MAMNGPDPKSTYPMESIEPNGSDNTTFRLGKKMSVRLPSGSSYALQVEKEQKWLP